MCAPRAHPRSRGENPRTVIHCCALRGSSPLTRGKLKAWGDTILTGLIPAHAGKTSAEPDSASGSRAHPRSRGENALLDAGAYTGDGSSPLTRGKPDHGQIRTLRRRLIPAHAGKTFRSEWSQFCETAHPRSRGENRIISPYSSGRLGSSPLTRGKPRAHAVGRGCRGLIPAHAGKTVSHSCMGGMAKAHPRSRGENEDERSWTVTRLGSSPLTRGKLCAPPAYRDMTRLIPAHAGKTRSAHAAAPRPSAHPRSRGENFQAELEMIQERGSSPLTRGKRQIGLAHQLLQRLIPAHAGKTRRRASPTGGRPAHPRSRGENAEYGLEDNPDLGSSPLTRGKRPRHALPRSELRLIPAHAGKTWSPGWPGSSGQAHPRSRGENALMAEWGFPQSGSSPLTRGKHVPVVQGHLVGRLIPAHAGKTSLSAAWTVIEGAHPRSRGENG